MLNDKFKLSGRVNILLKDINGKIRIDKTYDNYITNVGKAYIAYGMNDFTYTTTSVSGSTITQTGHTYADGDEVIFTNLGGNTGVTLNTLYFIVGVASNTFQVSATLGGSAISITGTAPMTYRHHTRSMVVMAVGTGNTLPADATLTSLVAETTGITAPMRKSVVPTRTTTTVTNDAIQYVASWAAGENYGALNEAGIFNAGVSGSPSGGGIMLCRTVFGGGSIGVINKGVNDSLQITWKITVA
jgi:hypothetical protein